jgi:hypothetical protein
VNRLHPTKAEQKMLHQNPSAYQPHSHKDRNIAAAVTIAVLTVAVIVLVALYLQNNAKPVSTPVVQVIIDGNLTINPGAYSYYNFTVHPGLQGATIRPTVQGTFNVTDETENTIAVYIMDTANFCTSRRNCKNRVS